MIIHLKNSVSEETAKELGILHKSILLKENNTHILITAGSVKNLPQGLEDLTESFYVTDSDIQLASRNYRKETREVKLGSVTIGGNSGNTVMISGPCSVESEEQITLAAELCVKLGVKILRAGCYKPRTSPYSFQGLGLEGLKLLAKMREKYGLAVITEVKDASHIEEIIEYSDIIQIGAKAMYDHGILNRCGKTQKPVLIKRGFGSTLQEFVQSAEFVLSGGNPNVILCERGIRTFETKTRFTLDLCGVAYLKEYTNLPVVLDPSHAMGYAYGVPDLTRACMAMGVDGLLIETHPTPKSALSDASQQLDFNEFTELYNSLKPLATALNRNLV
ncbi:MAG: 3-deoxy-7-phosphoheptulonate synthase [Flavobacteriales bacterium]|nr:3-deoxy-7-phosphoheptulonate synthase [Flavobacteriales bacterium]